uniref:Uncharacterized protein n=1 Tax=Glossina austeni TaxID=7395 RepID=A0A1A9VUA2_GLOAU
MKEQNRTNRGSQNGLQPKFQALGTLFINPQSRLPDKPRSRLDSTRVYRTQANDDEHRIFRPEPNVTSFLPSALIRAAGRERQRTDKSKSLEKVISTNSKNCVTIKQYVLRTIYPLSMLSFCLLVAWMFRFAQTSFKYPSDMYARKKLFAWSSLGQSTASNQLA